MYMCKYATYIAFLFCVILSGAARAQSFVPGNLAVLRVDGTTSAASPVTICEYDPVTGVLVNSRQLPSSGSGNYLTLSGSTASDGNMTLDSERLHVIIPGYNAVAGTGSLVTGSGANRIIASFDSNSYTFPANVPQTLAFNGNNFRSATAAGDRYYGAGAGGGTNGVRLMLSGSSISIVPSGGTRTVAIYNGQLFYSTGSGIYVAGASIPTAPGPVGTIITSSTLSAAYNFAISPDGNTIYIADETSGILKCTRTGGTGTFSTPSVLSSIPAQGLTVDFTVSPALIYATTFLLSGTNALPGNALIKITDGSSTVDTLAVASATSVFKSVTFTPNYSAKIVGGGTTICSGTTTTLTFYGNPGDSVTYAVNGTNKGLRIRNTGVYVLTDTLTATNVDSVYTYALVNITGSLGTVAVSGSVSLTVQPSIPAPFGGSLSVCAGGSFSLTDATPGGTWSSVTPAIASISASGNGTGGSAGVATISYSLTNVCGLIARSASFTVNPLPATGTIGGPSAVCAGGTITLTTTGNTGTVSWSGGAPIATINSTTGALIAGSTAGTAVITYTAATPTCGSASATVNITVNPLPNAGAISGTDSVCVGSVISLTSSGTTGGTWFTTTSSIATVTSTGVVGGVAAGTAVIKYRVTTPTCGSDTAQKTILVRPLPNAGLIGGPTSVCAGASITLTNVGSVGVGTWSGGSSLATINSATGVLIAGSTTGTAVVTYTAATPSCGNATTTVNITINALPNAGVLSGNDSVCAGSVISLTTSGTGGGTWVSLNTAVATVSSTGVVGGVASGSAVIRYRVTTPTCGSDSVQKNILVRPLPNAGIIGGPTAVCAGASATLTNTGAVGAGTWSGGSSLATINSTTGVLIAGSTTGTAVVTYTAATPSCGNATTTVNITINALPNAGVLSGNDSVCAGSVISLTTSGTGGGTWVSLNTAVATVSSTGVVGGVASGSAVIRYRVTTPTCGSDSVQKNILVRPLPNAGVIGGPTSVCAGASITLTNTGAVGVGTWSGGSSLATINGATGILVAGSTTGTAVVTYTATTPACGNAITTANIVVNALPHAGSISGSDSVCAGSVISLTSSGDAFGQWSTSNSSIATINAAGVAGGAAMGSAIIKYKVVTPSCGSDSTTKAIVVNPLPAAGTISGASNVCAAAVITLSATGTTGVGAWSTSSSLATVNPVTGVVTAGLVAGVATISYTAHTFSCGNSIATYVVTVNPLPDAGTITGSDTLCPGTAATLASSGMGGGTWTSANAAVATVNTVGVVTAVATGNDVISYRVSTPTCGSDTATLPVFVRALPNAGTITGGNTVCTGFVLTLADAAVGGVWSSSNSAVASVSGGIVTGHATGTATITYAVTNICTTAIATAIVNVVPAIIPPISGGSVVCAGSNLSLSNPAAGGTWLSTNTAVANVSASGIVTGVSQGVTVISYTVLNSCGLITDTQSVQVNPLPVAGTIVTSSGTVVCSGAYLALSNATTGGVWSSSNTAVAVISPSGIVSGITTGTTIIYYSVTNSCGTATDTAMITVNTAPASGGAAQITTMSPAWLCDGAMYQNFGTSSAAPTGEYYQWSANNAQVYATGAGAQYCLVNFPFAGEATIYLSTFAVGNICPLRDTFIVEVGNSTIDHPTVSYSAGLFNCNQEQSTYQWGYDDALTLAPTVLNGETARQYSNASPDFANKYYWVITEHLLCEQKTYYRIPAGVVNISNHDNYMAQVYPNPTAGDVYVKTSAPVAETGTITVTDLAGRVVYVTSFETNSTMQLPLNNASGVYIVTVRSQHILYTTKVIAQ